MFLLCHSGDIAGASLFGTRLFIFEADQSENQTFWSHWLVFSIINVKNILKKNNLIDFSPFLFYSFSSHAYTVFDVLLSMFKNSSAFLLCSWLLGI